MHVHNSKQQFEKTHNQSKTAQKNPMLLLKITSSNEKGLTVP
jgi:hypothetical protein